MNRNPEPRTRRIRLLVASLFAAIILYVAVRSFDLRAVSATFGTFQRSWIMAAVAVALAQVVLQLLRFRVVFEPPAGTKLTAAGIFSIVTEGQLLNALTPLRTGDAYKVVSLQTWGVSAATTLAALLVERAGDLLALLLVTGGLSATVLFHGLSDISSHLGAVAGARGWIPLTGAAVVAGLLLAGLVFLLRRLRAFVQRLYGLLASWRFAGCFGVAIFGWIFEAGVLFCVARAAGMDFGLPQAIASIFILNLGLAIPLSVANVGVFEGSLAFALKASGPAGMPLAQAVGVAAALHLIQIVGLVSWVLVLFGIRAASVRLSTPTSSV